MKTKIEQALIAGIAGTAAMTMLMFIAPMMGIPKMNAAEMLSGMIGVPIIIGWVMHFMIGVIFAALYTFFSARILNKTESNVMKGVIFGLMVFAVAQLAMVMMGQCILCMPNGGISMFMGSLMGHILYGIVVVLIVKERVVKAA